LTSNLPAVPT